jgi:hypothetical protein
MADAVLQALASRPSRQRRLDQISGTTQRWRDYFFSWRTRMRITPKRLSTISQ